jgi:hypothetical protein
LLAEYAYLRNKSRIILKAMVLSGFAVKTTAYALRQFRLFLDFCQRCPVGKWVWLDVSPARKPGLASGLWALGFHWNQRRGVWQHPCGSFNPFGIHPAEPRAKYRSYFPADILPA